MLRFILTNPRELKKCFKKKIDLTKNTENNFNNIHNCLHKEYSKQM